MAQENVILYNPAEELDEDLNINLKKIWMILWSRKWLLVKVFWSIMIFFILLTFILPKKYIVSADLYINKTNNSNMTEINPYALDDASGTIVSMGADKSINNEIELMKSSLVLDKVIRENNIIYRKKWGIIPNKKEGEYLTAKVFYGKGKSLKFENIKNTNVITVSYKSKYPELAYGVVSSLITNYIELHKDLNSEKSRSDKELLETEYAKTKASLNQKLNQSTGLPVQSMSGIGNLSAMSAFSRSASSAIGSLKSQYVAGERSQIAISEESQKLSQLATKLEWAKMVEQMSDSSKVLILHEPQQLRLFENSSPKMKINILLGIIFGSFISLLALLIAEIKDDKLSYSMLTDNIIFDGDKKIDTVITKIFSYNPKKILVISMLQLPNEISNKLISLSNCEIAYPEISKNFIEKISSSDKIMLISQISKTKSETYKMVREIIKNQDKNIIFDVLM